MYSAGFLGAITRGARANNLRMTNYFEPVNEGAIKVSLSSAARPPAPCCLQLSAAACLLPSATAKLAAPSKQTRQIAAMEHAEPFITAALLHR